jgi:hypothetical protein
VQFAVDSRFAKGLEVSNEGIGIVVNQIPAIRDEFFTHFLFGKRLTQIAKEFAEAFPLASSNGFAAGANVDNGISGCTDLVRALG